MTKNIGELAEWAPGIALGLAIIVAFGFDHFRGVRNSGEYIDPITDVHYHYRVDTGSKATNAYVWPHHAHAGLGIGVAKIRDFDGDGNIDHVGGFTYPRAPFEINRLTPENRESYQRKFDLAVAAHKSGTNRIHCDVPAWVRKDKAYWANQAGIYSPGL